jgi:hypothetical protein
VIPVASLIARMPTSEITVRTFAAPTGPDVYGRITEGAATEATEFVPVHPTTSREMLDRVPEADRRLETIAVYPRSDSALAPDPLTTPTEIDYNGETYTVVWSGNYAAQGGVYLVLAQKQRR